MLKQINPTHTQAWKNLAQDKANFKGKHLRNLFINDPLRFKELSIKEDNLLLDFSKNLIDKTTLKHLKELFEECDVFDGIEFRIKKFGIRIVEWSAMTPHLLT